MATPSEDAAEVVLGADAAEAVRVAAAAADAGGHGGVEPGDVVITAVRQLSGGASRHTWMVDVAPGPAMVVQRERSGSIGANLPMAAQVDLLRAASGLGVPVPAVFGAGGSPGSGFVVLEALEGESVARRVLRDPALARARSGLASEAGRVLATIHALDPAEQPVLEETDPLHQMRALADALGEPHPAFELGLEWLGEHRPPERPPVVVHGDFRLGNLLVAPPGLTAVLDWELAHLGSPVEDLGWFCGRAWRFGSPLRAGGVGRVDELLSGYAEGGGRLPDAAELRWWEAYGTLRWGLICVLQASVHLRGHHRSVELAAIGRRAAECEEDLLELVVGPSDYQPPSADDRTGHEGPDDRPTARELLEAVSEHLEGLRADSEGAQGFGLRVTRNVVDMVGREVALAPETARRRTRRLAEVGVRDEADMAAGIRSGTLRGPAVTEVVRELVRDKLAVSHPGYWLGDG